VEAEHKEDVDCARESMILTDSSNYEDVKKLLQLPVIHPPVLIVIDSHIPSATKVSLMESYVD